VPKEFLHRPDVVAGLEQVRGKGMAQRMAAHVLRDPGRAYRLVYRSLRHGLVLVMAPDHSVIGIRGAVL
jgi:hypothetical protein